MARLLPFVACLVTCAVISAAQCSAWCLAAPCDNLSQNSAHQCHPSPEKRSPKCPLNHFQLNKAESAVDLGQAFMAIPAHFPPAQVTTLRARESVVVRLYERGAPPGAPLLTLLSELRI
jgi:hypothetical protein